MICNHDCFSCPFPDCINDSLRYEDYKEIDEIEKTIKAERAGIKGKKVAAQRKAYREANREKVAAQRKAYREANREKVAAQQKAWYEANRDRVAAQKKAWYEANKDRVLDQQKRYRKRRRDKNDVQL